MRFELQATMVTALQNGASLTLGSSHESYSHCSEANADTRKALLTDLD
jgi:hypothetical protein